ncbi:methyl-accepting chemotaxis protein [Oleidesulfovibrio sp.]|uniref:methyl-accepting chemotaxis protein n=1 Tax=Oleidesulfovibrio sp. TaxID=2909707 RepID=UPI003A84A9FB
MQCFKTIKGKISGIILICIVSLLCVLAISVGTMTKLHSGFVSMKENTLDGNIATTAINRDINYVSRLTRNIMLGSDAEKDIAKLGKRIVAIKKNFTILESGAHTSEEKNLVAKAKSAALAFVQDGLRFANNMRSIPKGERHTQYGAYGQSATPLAQASRKYFGELTKIKEQAYELEVQAFKDTINFLKWCIIGASAGIIVTIATMCILLQRSILRPLCTLTEYTKAVAKGDYSHHIDAASFSGELGQTAQSVSTMVDSLRSSMAAAEEHSRDADEKARQAEAATQQAEAEKARIAALLDMMHDLTTQVAAIVEELNAEAAGLEQDSEKIAAGAAMQHTRSQETAAAMEEMTLTISEVARNASLAASNSTQSKADAENGLGLVRQVITATDEVHVQTTNLQSTLGELSQRAESIGDIMSVISDIADQTNLLALNAAIEAARAGDAGRGFAVVADEVRKLAEKTMQATREVGEAIKGIQAGAGANVDSMNKVSEAVSRNNALTNEAGDALEAITRLVSESAVQVTSIATAAEQQSAACEEVNQATAAVSRTSEETAEGISRSATRIRNIAALVAELHALTEKINENSAV